MTLLLIFLPNLGMGGSNPGAVVASSYVVPAHRKSGVQQPTTAGTAGKGMG